MENSLLLNGKNYRLVPNYRLIPVTEKKWNIYTVYSDLYGMSENGPFCPLGHNGHSLPERHKIWQVRLGDKIFTVGDEINEGIIEQFIHLNDFNVQNSYVMASIKNSDVLVDIDNFKHVYR